jgi:acyl-CoA thioesterase
MENSIKEKIIKILENDRFASRNGITLIKAEPGHAIAKMKLSVKHMNGVDLVQGGAIFTLADFAFAAASNISGNLTVSASASISYFKSPKGKFLKAVANEVSNNKKLCNYSVDIYDEVEDLVAKFQTTGYIKGEHQFPDAV